MIKIDELKVNREVTRPAINEFGEKIYEQVEFTGYRQIETVTGNRRFMHYIIDMILIALFSNFIELFAKGYYESILNFSFILFNIFIVFIYLIIPYVLIPSLLEFYFQKTIGKFITQTLVINEYADKPNFKQCLLRSLIKLIPFEIFSCIGDKSRGWHDKWTKTYVVKEEEKLILQRLLNEQNETYDEHLISK